jgi:hypothetical protein
MSDLALLDENLPTSVGLPDNDEWERLLSMGDRLAKSKLIPKALQDKPADVLVILLHARELRLPAMLAVDKIHVIDGKPSMSAELMGALILRAGHHWKVVESTPTSGTVEFRRKEWPEDQTGVFSFTMDDAMKAGLLDIWWTRWVSRDDGSNRNRPEDWTLPASAVQDPMDVNDALLVEYEAPDWVRAQGKPQMKYRDPWWHYPISMLWARAASQAARMQFGDVLMGVSLTPEELGAEIDPMTGEVVNAPADDAVKTAMLARAQGLPPQQQAEMRKWFKDAQAPPIGRMTEKWVRPTDEKLAELENEVVLTTATETTGPPPAGTIDATSTPAEPPESAPPAAPDAPAAPPEAGDPEPADQPAPPAEGHTAPPAGRPDPLDDIEASVAAATAAREAAEEPPAAPEVARDAATDEPPADDPDPDPPSYDLPPWETADRDGLIALGKNRLVDAVKGYGGTPKAKATITELADEVLALRPFEADPAPSREPAPAAPAAEAEQGTLG